LAVLDKDNKIIEVIEEIIETIEIIIVILRKVVIILDKEMEIDLNSLIKWDKEINNNLIVISLTNNKDQTKWQLNRLQLNNKNLLNNKPNN